jgi:hypothetical protein
LNFGHLNFGHCFGFRILVFGFLLFFPASGLQSSDSSGRAGDPGAVDSSLIPVLHAGGSGEKPTLTFTFPAGLVFFPLT